MRIGFDGKRAVQNNTGLGNYSRYVIEALQEYYPEDEYVLYAPKERKNPRLDAILEKNNTRLRFPSTDLWRRFASLWIIWGVVADAVSDRISVFHGLSNELPLNITKQHAIRSVVTVHALIFRRLPSCYPLIDRLI